jgi:hypothetical protein
MKPNIFYGLVFVFLFQSGILFSQIPEDEIIITASSTLPASSTADFSPGNLMDGTSASWSEGAPGNGVGESFVFEFRYPDEMEYVVIKNGYGVEKYWGANGRIKTLKVTDQNGASRVLQLEDTPQLRVYGLTALVEDEYGVLQRGAPLSGSVYSFEILDVYEGERWQDVCITEVFVNEWYTESFPMSPEYLNRQLFMEYLNGIAAGDGILYVETDYDGFLPVDVSDGYYLEEIVSGDGTGGYKEHRLFVNEQAGDYYLFKYEVVIQPDQATMEGLNRDTGPTFDYTFSCEFMKYDLQSRSFLHQECSKLDDLFNEDPVAILSNIVGKDLAMHEIMIRYDEPATARFVYPAVGDREAEVVFRWNGAGFVQE